MSELKKLIEFIQNEYNVVNEKWKSINKNKSFNMKKTRVEDIFLDDQILNYVYDYIAFLKTNTMI